MTEKKHIPQSQDHIRLLYQKYGALLLGYIAAVVFDPKEAEEYLVTIFGHFAVDHKEHIHEGEVSWLNLLRYTRKLLPQLRQPNLQISKNVSHSAARLLPNDVGLSLLNNEEKSIFCAIYYHGQSIGDLAKSRNESESAIRSQFKLSFDKIRSARGN